MSENFKPRRFGKFVLTKKIAIGGMAEIYKAESYGVDGFKKVAVVKKILPHCSADSDFVSMLVDEAKLSVLLSHTNIVQVYELGKVEDDYFISMEFIHGINLREVLYRCRESGQKIPTDIAVFIISEICKGLDYAHRKTDENHQPLNIIHRDVSPQNILISFEGEVKIVDFGIAKAAMNISHTMAGVLKGKIAYMSPEQALGKPLDHRTDIFSAGILLYEILTNKRLFTGESQFEVLKKIRETRIREDDLEDIIPQALKPTVAKVLSYDRDKRYDNAGDLQTDLIRYLYSNHPDFTPRRLSEFITTLFADVLTEERSERSKEGDYASLTSSLSLDASKQVDIIAAPDDVTKPVITTEGLDKTTRRPTPKQKSKKRKSGLFMKIGALAILAGLAYGALKLTPIIKPFFETKEAQVVEKAEKPEPEFSSINLTSNPTGATIFIDNENTSLTTPARLANLRIGPTYLIKLELDGFEPAEKSIPLTTADPVNAVIELKRITGSLFITSEPAGAKILIDGKDTEMITPATVESVPLNVDQKIKIRKDGFEDLEQTINLSSTKLQPIAVRLEELKPKNSTINISSNPSGATIYLNGNKTGKTTPSTITDIGIGEYEIKLELSGFDTWTRKFDVSKPDNYDFTALLSRPTEPVRTAEDSTKPQATTGSIKITSNPSGATILIDGISTGKRTPATISNIYSGSHRITLEINGYERWSDDVNVVAGQTVNKSARLAKSKTAVPERLIETPVQLPRTPAPPPVTPQYPTTPPPAPAPAPKDIVTGGVGTIKISSDPSDADVFINGEFMGKTPLNAKVPSGSARIVVNKDGRQRHSSTVNVKPNETVTVPRIVLGDIFGQVNLTSVPPAASVIFDGKPIPPKTPVTIKKVTKDVPHTITVTYPGYKSWTKTFKITGSGNEITLNAFLEK